MKQFLCLFTALLLALALAGCSEGNTSSGGEPDVNSFEEQLAPPAEAGIPIKDKTKLTVYFLNTNLYSSEGRAEDVLFVPVEREISAALTPNLLTGFLTEKRAEQQLSINTVALENEIARVDMKSVNTGSSVYLNEEFFANCTLTLKENCGVTRVLFTLNGGQIAADRSEEYDGGAELGVVPAEKVPFLAEGEFDMPAYHLPAVTREEIAALRESVSYEDALAQNEREAGELFLPFFPNDARAKEITRAIQEVTRYNIPETDFDTIADAPNEFIVMAAMLNAPDVYWRNDVSGAKAPQLNPITEIVDDTVGNLQEHVALTAKRLFGEDVTFTHSGKGISPWKYSEYAGVYTSPHMGAGYRDAILLDYTEEGDTVTATAVFFSYYFEEHPKDKTLEEHYKTGLPRHQFTLQRQGESYRLTGHSAL